MTPAKTDETDIFSKCFNILLEICYLYLSDSFIRTIHSFKSGVFCVIKNLILFSGFFTLLSCKQFEESAPPEPEKTAYVPSANTNSTNTVSNVPTCDTSTMACPPPSGWPAEFLTECQKGRSSTDCSGPIEKGTYDAILKAVELSKGAGTCTTRYVNGVAGNVANFRSSKDFSTSANIHFVPANGTIVTTSAVEGSWIKTTLRGKTGYFHKTVLSCQYVAPQANTTTGGETTGGNVPKPPAAPPPNNGGCKGTFPNRCTVKAKGVRPQINCWGVKKYGDFNLNGKKIDSVDDDRIGLSGNERDCFTQLKDIRVEWGPSISHRNSAARFSQSWGCYVEEAELDCDCENLKCN
jgi:hypothetical protein